jgi:hypothetical protein
LPLAAATARWNPKSASTASSGAAATNDSSAARTTSALAASTRAAASAAASLSRPRRKSIMSRTSWWVRMAADSTVNDVGSGMASTKEPRPWKVSTRPSVRSRVTASLTTVRDTPNSSMSSASDGSLWPGGRSPARILSFRPATTRWASDVVIGTSSPHHRLPNSALSFVSARICSLSVKPRPGRSASHIRPSRISMRSSKSGLSHSKCSTHGSVGYAAARCR